MLLNTECNQTVDVSECIPVPTPRITRAEVPKIHANTPSESNSLK
jgi:hypothetical protein